MDNNGYIKLHRSILKWEWWGEHNTTLVFLYLLLNAQWEDTRYRGYEIPRGSLITSYASISKNLNISVKSARVAINHLKATGEVAVKGQAHFSIVTIVNWDKFQGLEEEEGKHFGNHLGIQGAGKGQAKGNIQEYKEIKNIRREEYSVADCEAIQNLFNDVCYNFSACRNLTKTRLEKVRILLSEFALDDIKKVFEKANGSDYLTGKNDRGWRAGFDWIIEVDNFVKIQDGNFDNRENKKSRYDFDEIDREIRNKQYQSASNPEFLKLLEAESRR